VLFSSFFSPNNNVEQGAKIKKLADSKLAAQDYKAAIMDYIYSSLHFYNAAEWKFVTEKDPVGARQLLRETAQLLIGKEKHLCISLLRLFCSVVV
jgi:hypothetical protein